jgi:hypothetical protein
VSLAVLDRRAAPSPAPRAAGIQTVIEYDRTPPEAWERLVWSVAPPSEHLSWFALRWEPGDVWQPVHRWVIWHMRPKGRHPRLLDAALRGPHPRSSGHYCGVGYCPCAIKANHWVGGPSSGVGVDRQTWELFRETGCYGQRWWVVQGTNGGHRFTLDPIEAKVFKLHTGRSDTPAPGDLPYADVDRRVLRHLLAYDKLALWKGAIRFGARGDAQLSREVQHEVEQSRLALLRWLENQTDLLWDEERSRIKRVLDAVPRIPGYAKDTTDYEAEQAAYLAMPHADTALDA